jgi:hypothetical protein
MAENIYKKLMSARVALSQKDLKKSGHNTFANFKYFELPDFVPTLDKILTEVGLCTVFDFSGNPYKLQVVDVDDPQTNLAFYYACPDGTVLQGKVNPAQEVGARQTYARRYLYLQAFDIVEPDTFDATQGKDAPKQQRNNAPVPAPKPAPVKQPATDELAQCKHLRSEIGKVVNAVDKLGLRVFSDEEVEAEKAVLDSFEQYQPYERLAYLKKELDKQMAARDDILAKRNASEK